MSEQIDISKSCCKNSCCANGCCSDGCKTGECSNSCCSDGCCSDLENCLREYRKSNFIIVAVTECFPIVGILYLSFSSISQHHYQYLSNNFL